MKTPAATKFSFRRRHVVHAIIVFQIREQN
jgi:hypothetical protein